MQNDTRTNKKVTPDLPGGYDMGQSATSLEGFYGATPIAQPSGATQAIVLDTSGGTAHYDTGIQALSGTYNATLIMNSISTLAAAVAKIQTDLKALGLVKGGA